MLLLAATGWSRTALKPAERASVVPKAAITSLKPTQTPTNLSDGKPVRNLLAVNSRWLQQQQQDGDNEDIKVVKVAMKPDIPLNPLRVKGKGRPTGAIATAPSASNKGKGITSIKRLPSAFKYELQDKVATTTPVSIAPA